MTIASIAPTKVNDRVIATLEDLLRRAQAGELVAVVVCGEQTGREVRTAVAGDFDVFRMLGALELAKRKVLARVVVSDSERHG